MKKKISVLLTVVFSLLLWMPTASAANRVPEMEIEVALCADGSARIREIWTTDTDSGTEFYLARHDSGYLSISDFAVSDQNGSYLFVENWDIDASFEKKANKCGIVETDKGVELCWGISEYGENRYIIEYVIHDLVGSYSDVDGFNHRFVDEMSFFPSDVVLTIYYEDGTPITDENCDIWAFGYLGQVQFEEGVIRAWSEEPLESGHNMTIMVAIEKGMLSPQRSVEGSFETLKQQAFDGSDYGEEDSGPLTFGDVLLFIAILLFPVVLIVGIARIFIGIGKRKRNRRVRKAEYFRDAPNDGNLNATYQLGLVSNLCEEDALLGAYLLRLVSHGSLECCEDSLDEEESARLRLCHAPRSGDEYEDVLYTILEAAAGADGILNPQELQNYCKTNYKPMFRFMDSCERNGMQALVQGSCLKYGNLETEKDLTKEGQRQLNEIYGLKHFLLDFSLIRERGIEETVIWQDYMVYAHMMGIADKLEAQIRDLYPDQLPQLERYHQYIYHTSYYNGLMYREYSRQRMMREPKRSSGSGGSASFRGGGGFSGGGGGGTR